MRGRRGFLAALGAIACAPVVALRERRVPWRITNAYTGNFTSGEYVRTSWPEETYRGRTCATALLLAFLWTQAATAAPCRDVVTGAFIKCPETFVMDAGLGVVASLSSEASAGEPTAELGVGFDVADANKSPRMDLVARFGALPGATVDLADPTTFRSMGLEGYLSQPLSSVLRLKPAVLIGLEFRFDGNAQPLHRAARFGYLGVRFDSKQGYLFLGAGGDERLSTHERSTPQYLPSATVAWRVRLANLTGKVDAYLTGRVLLFLRLGYGAPSAGSDVAQIGVLIGGGKR